MAMRPGAGVLDDGVGDDEKEEHPDAARPTARMATMVNGRGSKGAIRQTLVVADHPCRQAG